MPTYRLRVQLDAPLAVSESRSEDGRYQTPPYVPAPTLRGALAAHLDRAGLSQEALNEVFGEAGCRTTRLVPLHETSSPGSGGYDEEEAPSEEGRRRPETFPVPLTLNTCKRHGGFQGETRGQANGPAHGAEDTLLATLRFATQDEAEMLRALQQCEECGNVLVPMGGFARRTNGGYVTQPAPPKRTQVHVGRDRRRKGAESGVLYAREMIQESGSDPVLMEAEVRASEDNMEQLAGHIEASSSEDVSPGEEGGGATVLNVGTAISRGLGRCRVRAFEPAEKRRPVRERAEALNEAWQAVGGEGPVVTLTLRTPAFFVNEWLRPEMSPPGSALLQAAREPEQAHAQALSSLKRLHQVARPHRLQAWNGMAGFPHATDQGLAAGSVLVYRPPELSDALFEALAHVEQAGVGLRREFGFGTVVACDPLHAEVHEHSGARS
jgi:CRISPR-associated Csx10 family RAMP protein